MRRCIVHDKKTDTDKGIREAPLDRTRVDRRYGGIRDKRGERRQSDVSAYDKGEADRDRER